MRKPLILQMQSLLFAFSVFSGAYLLFQIEPLIAKFILPWFGGSPTVWTTCMLFFQLMLLLGYTYAHLSLERMNILHQSKIHIVLLLAAMFMLPISPPTAWKPDDSIHPTLLILSVLLGSVGLPYFVLSSTGPLLQAWFIRLSPGQSPYPLYALSNFGSLLALISYPFIFEPYFRLKEQSYGWSFAFVIFALACLGLAIVMQQRKHRLIRKEFFHTRISTKESLLSDVIPKRLLWIFWLSLPAAASTLLLATTNQLCQDVTSVPFLWIVPLALYLLSFILCYARKSWYTPRFYLPAMVMGIFAMVTMLYSGSSTELISQVVIYNVGFFFCCMVCHGELYRLRPHPNHLTSYYLATSAGGAIGGLFVALIAPLIFPLYFEFHIAIFLCCALPLLVMAEEQVRLQHGKNLWLIRSLFIVVLTLLAGRLLNHAFQLSADKTVVSRNFYGILRVEERSLDQPELARRLLRHGSIDHGYQFLAKDKQDLATAYYGRESGIAAAFSLTQSIPERKIGIVGLGVGTLLSYSRKSDTVRLYEINPTVVRLAQEYFTYIDRSKANKTLIVGDARLELDREPDHHFNLFVLDAFSGDAIPMHLLTIQAIQLYLRHLEPNGILAVNISNHHLDLSPVIRALGEASGLHYLIVHQEPSDDGITEYASNWALLSKDPKQLEGLRSRTLIEPQTSVLWTDDFSNLFKVLR